MKLPSYDCNLEIARCCCENGIAQSLQNMDKFLYFPKIQKNTERFTLVSLTKNQTVSLTKTAGSPLTKIAIGLGWDPAKKSKPKGFFSSLLSGGSDSIDLDASCVLLDKQGNEIDLIWFSKLKSSCGNVKHQGDNLTGEGDGDDEVINVNLAGLSAQVEHLAITVNSFRGQTFDEVDNAFCRVVDDGNNRELCDYKLAEQGSHTGILIAVLSREGDDWVFKAHGLACTGKMVKDMLPQIKSAII